MGVGQGFDFNLKSRTRSVAVYSPRISPRIHRHRAGNVVHRTLPAPALRQHSVRDSRVDVRLNHNDVPSPSAHAFGFALVRLWHLPREQGSVRRELAGPSASTGLSCKSTATERGLLTRQEMPAALRIDYSGSFVLLLRPTASEHQTQHSRHARNRSERPNLSPA